LFAFAKNDDEADTLSSASVLKNLDPPPVGPISPYQFVCKNVAARDGEMTSIIMQSPLMHSRHAFRPTRQLQSTLSAVTLYSNVDFNDRQRRLPYPVALNIKSSV